MSSQDDEPEIRVMAFVLMAAVVLAVGLAVGIGVQKSRGGASASGTAMPAPTTTAAPVAMPVGDDDASVVVENGVVKFYFASGKADLASGALDALGEAINAAKAGKKLVISGFHDATGSAAANAELARQRAMVVRDALVGAGVKEDGVELKKPEQTTGSGNNAEARRVEVMIAP